MASSSEAFEKFWQWNKAKTWLNVTVVELGKAADHLFARIGVVEAEFSVEERRVVAARNADEWVIFEESESRVDM